MARQSFRGAGGGGAVVLPSLRPDVSKPCIDSTPEPAFEVDRRTGALLMVASGLISIVGIVAASGALLS
jgi:hypothetical protein